MIARAHRQLVHRAVNWLSCTMSTETVLLDVTTVCAVYAAFDVLMTRWRPSKHECMCGSYVCELCGERAVSLRRLIRQHKNCRGVVLVPKLQHILGVDV